MRKEKYPAFMAIITADIIDMIMDKYDIDENTAMSMFHKSKLYSVLEREDTKVWHYSSHMMLELFDEELNGNLEFPEV